jgi:tetratricopeptide (TPR) repeat protein
MRRTVSMALAILAVSGAATAAARVALEPEANQRAAIRDPAFLPSGKVLRATAFGQRLLLADLYWLRTVQYMGETLQAKADRWSSLYPLAEIVTDLDPRHGYVYQVAGSNLAGLAGRHAEADRILQKGMRNVPERWTLPWVLATNKFLYEQQYAEAAEYARRASVVGRRPDLALLAANLSALADTEAEYQAALGFLDQALKDAANDDLREQLETRRVKVATYMVLSRLEKALAAFQQDEGHPAHHLADLVPRYLPVLPDDPSGGTFLLSPATGEVSSSVIGPRAPLRVVR